MSPGARNNIIAGLFIVLSLSLGVWASFLLSDRGVTGGLGFKVRFSLAQGAVGLKKGSPVQLGGQQIGQVESVDFERGKGRLPTAVLVNVRVRGDLPLYDNALVYLDRPLLGTLSSINIADAGGPDSTMEVVPPDGTTPARATPAPPVMLKAESIIDGSLAPPAFLAAAGYGPQQVQQVKRAITRLDTMLAKAEQAFDKTTPKLDDTLGDVRAIVADLRKNLGKWSEQADTIVADVRTASGKLGPLLENADAGVTDARGLITQARQVVSDNRDKIDRIIANADTIAARLDKQTAELLNGALADARAALGSASDVLRRFSAMLTEEEPGVRRTLANMRLMSDQLKLTAVEVRSQPWRLLHQPTTKEFESQVLFDSTRAYASAASDLRAAAEALQAATAPGATPTPDQVRDLTGRLSDSYAAYHAAENALLDTLVVGRTTKVPASK